MNTYLIRENKYKSNVVDKPVFRINAASPVAAAQLYLSETYVNECPICLYVTDMDTKKVSEFTFQFFVPVVRDRL